MGPLAGLTEIVDPLQQFLRNAAQVRKRDRVGRYPVQHAGSSRRIGIITLGEALALRSGVSDFGQQYAA